MESNLVLKTEKKLCLYYKGNFEGSFSLMSEIENFLREQYFWNDPNNPDQVLKLNVDGTNWSVIESTFLKFE